MKRTLTFYKISATGNDFILFDNRTALLESRRDAAFFSRLCRPHTAVGADGVILLEQSDRADFRYVHVNSDGSLAEMCGNGSRAVSWFAQKLGVVQDQASFEINGHLYHSTIHGLTVTTDFIPAGRPMLSLPVIEEPALQCGGLIDTGVPHLVIFVDQVAKVDVAGVGRKYRHHPFFPKGTNVDFVQPGKENELSVRTFERGVEAETLACGTGAVAAALIAHVRKGMGSPCRVRFPGGIVQVDFSDDFHTIRLTGEVTPVFHGVLEEPFHA